MIQVQHNNGRIELQGVLDHVSVTRVLEQSRDWFDADVLDISLQGVEQSNSAGLALLLEWQKIAQQKNRTIHFHDVPEQLRTIARAYGVDELLAIAA